MQNEDGGLATYELTRSYAWMEVISLNTFSHIFDLQWFGLFFQLFKLVPLCVCTLVLTDAYAFSFQMINPAETFGDIVIDYP